MTRETSLTSHRLSIVWSGAGQKACDIYTNWADETYNHHTTRSTMDEHMQARLPLTRLLHTLDSVSTTVKAS